MGDGPPRLRRDFSCPAVLRIHSGGNEVSTTGLLPSLAGLSRPVHLPRSFVTPYRVSYNPKRQASWFGLFPFRSPLLRESIFLSLPAGTKMFQFSASTFDTLCIYVSIIRHNSYWVPPFGNLWITAYLQLPKAYRR